MWLRARRHGKLYESMTVIHYFILGRRQAVSSNEYNLSMEISACDTKAHIRNWHASCAHSHALFPRLSRPKVMLAYVRIRMRWEHTRAYDRKCTYFRACANFRSCNANAIICLHMHTFPRMLYEYSHRRAFPRIRIVCICISACDAIRMMLGYANACGCSN